MTDLMLQEASALRSLLERERALLQTGDVYGAVALAEEKAQAISALEKIVRAGEQAINASQIREHLQAVATLAAENAKHFDAMRHGLGSLIARVQAIGSDSGVGVYNQYGSKMEFNGAYGGYLKKA